MLSKAGGKGSSDGSSLPSREPPIRLEMPRNNHLRHTAAARQSALSPWHRTQSRRPPALYREHDGMLKTDECGQELIRNHERRTCNHEDFARTPTPAGAPVRLTRSSRQADRSSGTAPSSRRALSPSWVSRWTIREPSSSALRTPGPVAGSAG